MMGLVNTWLPQYWGTSCALGIAMCFVLDIATRSKSHPKHGYRHMLPCILAFCVAVSPVHWYMSRTSYWVYWGHVCLYGYMVIRMGVRYTAKTQYHTLSLYVALRLLLNMGALNPIYISTTMIDMCILFLFLFDIGSLAFYIVLYWRRTASLVALVLMYTVCAEVIAFGYLFVWTNTVTHVFLVKAAFGSIWIQRIFAALSMARIKCH